jgi:uroporphyrinogen-III synthase
MLRATSQKRSSYSRGMPYAVITREPEAMAAYAEALRPLGLDALAMPVTRHETIDCGLDRVLRDRTYDAIAIASARGAHALVEAWNAPPRPGGRIVVATWFEVAWGEPPDPPKPELDAQGRAVLPRVWAVGPATGRVLADAGIQAIVDPEAADAESLAQVLIKALGREDRSPPLRGTRILAPRAAGGRPEMLDTLVYAGATIDAMSVYKTFHADPADEAIADGKRELEGGDAVMVCVFAPSQVEALVNLVPIDAAMQYVAIGDTTATALRAAGAKRVAVAAEPTPEGLAKAVRAVYPPRP